MTWRFQMQNRLSSRKLLVSREGMRFPQRSWELYEVIFFSLDLWMRPPLKKSLFPVQRLVEIVGRPQYLFVFASPHPPFFFVRKYCNFWQKKKNWQNELKKRSNSAVISSPGHWSGNNIFSKGGLTMVCIWFPRLDLGISKHFLSNFPFPRANSDAIFTINSHSVNFWYWYQTYVPSRDATHWSSKSRKLHVPPSLPIFHILLVLMVARNQSTNLYRP